MFLLSTYHIYSTSIISTGHFDRFTVFNNNTLLNITVAKSLYIFIITFLEYISRSKMSDPKGTDSHFKCWYSLPQKNIRLHMLPPCLYIMHMYHSLPSIWYGQLFNLTQSESRKHDSTLYFLNYQGDETWSHHFTGFVFFCEITLQIFSHLYCGGSSLLFWFRGLFLKNITFSLSYIANSLGLFFSSLWFGVQIYTIFIIGMYLIFQSSMSIYFQFMISGSGVTL